MPLTLTKKLIKFSELKSDFKLDFQTGILSNISSYRLQSIESYSPVVALLLVALKSLFKM